MFPAISNLVKQGIRSHVIFHLRLLRISQTAEEIEEKKSGRDFSPPFPPFLSPIPGCGERKEDEEEEEEEGEFRMLLRCLGEMLLPRETFKTAAAAASFP